MKRLGFTLIELLVVIGIITLLLGILFPALQAAKKQARTVACSATINQINLAMTAYEIEHDAYPNGFDDLYNIDGIIPPGGYVGDAVYDRMGWWWFQSLEGYLGSNIQTDTAIRCPSRNIQEKGVLENPLMGNYGVNRAILKYRQDSNMHHELTGKPLGVSQIAHPSQTLLIADCGYSVISWLNVLDNSPMSLGLPREEKCAYIPGLLLNQRKSVWEGTEQDAINGRHGNKKINMGFPDGHLETRNAEDLYVHIDGDHYRNQRPLWRVN